MSRGDSGRRGKLRELAEGAFGQEFYGLHDNGVTFADSQREITPMQRFLYVLSKDYHTDDVETGNPSGMGKAHGATQGF